MNDLSNMENEEAIFAHLLNKITGIGPKRLRRLHEHFGSFKAAFLAPTSAIEKSGIETPLAESIVKAQAATNIEKERQNLAKHRIEILLFSDTRYPIILKEISTPPPILYYKGTLPPCDSLFVAVVGTRKSTAYGHVATNIITSDLARSGCIIVSGLAFGIDAHAHKAALSAKGKTVAVLGCGLDEASLYPKEHALLAEEIFQSGGCLFSEYPPGTPGLKQNFIQRNRIVAGLSTATIVVESDVKSGALVTAKFALEENRTVFAVPGPITSKMSEGPNRLLQQGARVALDAKDILSELNMPLTSGGNTTQASLPTLSAIEKIVLETLTREAKLPDIVSMECGLSAGQVASALGFLELKGLVKNLGANQYVKNY